MNDVPQICLSLLQSDDEILSAVNEARIASGLPPAGKRLAITIGMSYSEIDRLKYEAIQADAKHDVGPVPVNVCASIMGIGTRTLFRRINEWKDADPTFSALHQTREK